MERIPTNLNEKYGGEIITPDTFSANKVYYNGSDNLSAIHVDCSSLTTNPRECVHLTGCGWCNEKKTCIPGSIEGPQISHSCLKNTFLFTAPSANWNPLRAGDINILTVDKQNRSQVHLTENPDMNNVNIYAPYK